MDELGRKGQPGAPLGGNPWVNVREGGWKDGIQLQQLMQAQQGLIRVVNEKGEGGLQFHIQMGEPTVKAAFLGVEAMPIEGGPAGDTLRAQLKLHEGVGLIVGEVVSRSPAAAAGLKVHDVLVKLDDQMLVDYHQLAVVVRTAPEEGEEVTLTVMRDGKQESLKAKLEERDLPPLSAMNATEPRGGGFRGS